MHVPGQPDFGHHPGYLNDPRYEWIGDFCEQHGARQKRITPKELGCLFIGLVLFIIFATVGLNYWGPKEIRESISLNSIIDAIKPPPGFGKYEPVTLKQAREEAARIVADGEKNLWADMFECESWVYGKRVNRWIIERESPYEIQKVFGIIKHNPVLLIEYSKKPKRRTSGWQPFFPTVKGSSSNSLFDSLYTSFYPKEWTSADRKKIKELINIINKKMNESDSSLLKRIVEERRKYIRQPVRRKKLKEKIPRKSLNQASRNILHAISKGFDE